MERVAALIEGYEDPYGMELLSSVHWVMQHDAEARENVNKAVAGVRSWSNRKRRVLKPEHLKLAWSGYEIKAGSKFSNPRRCPLKLKPGITINKLLEDAGWRFLPDGAGKRENIICEHRVAKQALLPRITISAMTSTMQPGGFVDYVLLKNTDDRAVAVVEAKRESIDPLTAKEQARAYAEGLGVSHIFLSNGLVHYYWNLRQGNPVKMSRFLPLEELGKAEEWRIDSASVSPPWRWMRITLPSRRTRHGLLTRRQTVTR